MSLGKEERNAMVALELERAKNTMDEMDYLQVRYGITWPAGYITRYSTLSVH